MDIKTRGLIDLKEQLRPYVHKLKTYLAKGRDTETILNDLSQGNIYRKRAVQKRTEPLVPGLSLAKCLRVVLTWTKDAKHRLLLFL